MRFLGMVIIIAAASVAAWIWLEGGTQTLYFWTLVFTSAFYLLVALAFGKLEPPYEGMLAFMLSDRGFLLILWLVFCAMPAGLSLLVSLGVVSMGFLWSMGKGVVAGLLALAVPEAYRPKGDSRHVVREQTIGNTKKVTYLKKSPGGYVTEREAYERSRGKGEWERTSRIERFILKYVLLAICMLVSSLIIKSFPVTIGLGAVFGILTAYLIAKRLKEASV